MDENLSAMAATPPAAETLPAREGADAGPWRILLVEDNRTVRTLLANMLADQDDFRATLAEDGVEALERLEADGFAYDVVVTDIEMPRMGGEELIGKVIAREPRMAIIVLTGHRNDRNVIRCLQLGAADYLVKPCAKKDFLRAIRRMLDRRSLFPRDSLRDLRVETPMDGWVELTAPTDFEYVERFNLFTAHLRTVPMDESAREAIQLAIGELGQNAVEWGNRHDRSKKIHLSYCLFRDRLVLKIEDEGEGFNVADVPDPSADPLAHVQRRLEEGKRPGGYGTFLIRRMMDEVLYNDAGNVVLMTKFIRPPEEDGKAKEMP